MSPDPLREQDSERRKLRAARAAVAVATALALLKLVTGVLTGSMAVIASAVDSCLDILMSGVNLVAIRKSHQPPDKQHPFGHGKFESLATLFQVTLIACSGVVLLLESVHRLAEGVELRRIEEGMGVLLVSVAASFAVSRHLRRVGKETESGALQADALHFSMDIYTNMALLAGLALVRMLELPWLDPLMSAGVALFILRQAWNLGKGSVGDILDEELPEQYRSRIAEILGEHRSELVDYHRLRTRRAGSQKIMDFHLTLCRSMTVAQSHRIVEELERQLKERIKGADVIIHVDPCARDHCPSPEKCSLSNHRKP